MIVDKDGSKIFVKNYIKNIEKILERLREVDLILFINKFRFNMNDIVVVGYLYGRYGKKSNLEKINIISKMKVYSSIIKIKSFLSVCVFY